MANVQSPRVKCMSVRLLVLVGSYFDRLRKIAKWKISVAVVTPNPFPMSFGI
jgi:hypothetical protein